MASVWFSVMVLILIQKALANVCNDDVNSFSCDECVRCGGQWCKEPGVYHCEMSPDDSWCPNYQENLMELPLVNRPGDLVTPIYAERTLYIDVPNTIDIHYTARSPVKPKINIKNTTQSFNINIKDYKFECSGLKCTSTIEATARPSFCSKNGTTTEFVHVELNVGGLDETVVLKYHVPCACECSKTINRSSIVCNTHGDLSCGVCDCHSGWTGVDCSKPICPINRGDLSCQSKNGLICAGNGECGPCETCVCYTDREGSQYFDQENDCEDICMVVNYCDSCLMNNTLGPCTDCSNAIFVEKYNESLLNQRDEHDKKIWVKCNETVDNCLVSYFAMKNETGDIVVMIAESCNTAIAGAQDGGAKVSILAAVFGILAVVAAVGAAMYWHHMKAVQPIPPNNPGYQNIVAEDSVGQNPLYKDPWSSFKNPMYGDKS